MMNPGLISRGGPVALLAAVIAVVLALPAGMAHASVSDDSDFSVTVHGTVLSVAPTANGRTIIGGTFTQIGSRPRTGLGAVWHSGYADRRFAPQLPAGSVVKAVATSPDLSVVYVGGSFDSINGVPRANLAALDAVTGEVIDNWQADTNGDVRDIVVAGDRIYVAGTFTDIDGAPRSRLAALDLAGEPILGFDPKPSWTVREVKVTQDGGTVYAIGAFNVIGGATRDNHLAGLDADTGVATGFQPAVGGGLPIGLGISPDGAEVIFSTENNQIIAYQPRVSNQPIWTNKGSGDTQAIAISDAGEVYIGGHFGIIWNGGDSKQKTRVGELASLRLADGTVTDWRPDVRGNMGPWDIVIASDRIEVAGDFSAAGGRQTGGFARYSGTP